MSILLHRLSDINPSGEMLLMNVPVQPNRVHIYREVYRGVEIDSTTVRDLSYYHLMLVTKSHTNSELSRSGRIER